MVLEVPRRWQSVDQGWQDLIGVDLLSMEAPAMEALLGYWST